MENPEVLTVFTGPHTYVSASWYSNPGMGSTWNYMSVHISGRMNFMSDASMVQLMKKLTLRFESGNVQSPTIFDNLPQDYKEKMLPGIVGFEIKAEKMDNVFKLSQNRDEISYHSIISHLEEQGGSGALIAREMRKRIQELFPSDQAS
jgi:transcriptional regulator